MIELARGRPRHDPTHRREAALMTARYEIGLLRPVVMVLAIDARPKD